MTRSRCADCRKRAPSGGGALCRGCASTRIATKLAALAALAAAHRRAAPEGEIDRLVAAAWGSLAGAGR